ncbi:DMT family transporter [Paenibacillus sp. TAB 01]|uniref:DMT family transporter n=1 Tax=Paenibacillus sp. TAB 01 TaxID=3368988 RepID=UPI0037539594
MIVFNYLLMCVIFGTTFLSIKIGVEAGMPPFFSAGLRFFIAGTLLCLWMAGRNKRKLSLLLRKELVLIGLGSTFCTFAALYWAEQHIDSGTAAILSATGPMMILMLQTLVLRKKAGTADLIGCLIGFTGVFLIMLPHLGIAAHGQWIGSCLLVLLGEIGYAAGSLYTRKVMLEMTNASPIAVNSIQMIYGGAALLLLSAGTEQGCFTLMLDLSAASSLLYLTVVGSMLGHSLYAWLLKKTNALFPSTWLYVSPVIAMTLGALLYGEPVSLASILGSMLVLSGIIAPHVRELRIFILMLQNRSRASSRKPGR